MFKLKSAGLYARLIENISQYELKLLRKYGSDITCSAGCDSCCILESVFPVEAYVIYESLKNGGGIHCDIKEGEEGKCVFLKNGLCSIYSIRPVICRTHGYPVFVEGRVDFCPENFRGRNSIDSEYILDLDNLNRALASINLIFSGETDEHFFKRDRIPLKDLAEFIIDK